MTSDPSKDEQDIYRSRSVAVFDEHTGALLSIQEELTKPGGEYAKMKPGFIINYQAVRSAAWTDAKPGMPPVETTVQLILHALR